MLEKGLVQPSAGHATPQRELLRSAPVNRLQQLDALGDEVCGGRERVRLLRRVFRIGSLMRLYERVVYSRSARIWCRPSPFASFAFGC